MKLFTAACFGVVTTFIACFSEASFVSHKAGNNRGKSYSVSVEGDSTIDRHQTRLFEEQPSHHTRDETRRQVLFKHAAGLSLVFGGTTLIPMVGNAEEFTRETKDFAYSFVPPNGFESTNKPLKTHLDEINFVSSDVKGYQVGITVDPVRINSLKEFGTPGEVAARVVTTEVNRDGVFDVTLVKDPVESDVGGYEINYLSSGKRGDKHFVANILIQNGMLYVVTGQVKEENYKEKESELLESVRSFRVKQV